MRESNRCIKIPEQNSENIKFREKFITPKMRRNIFNLSNYKNHKSIEKKYDTKYIPSPSNISLSKAFQSPYNSLKVSEKFKQSFKMGSNISFQLNSSNNPQTSSKKKNLFSKLYNEKIFNKKEIKMKVDSPRSSQSDLFLSEIYKLNDWKKIQIKVEGLHQLNEQADQDAQNEILSFLEEIKTESEDNHMNSYKNKYIQSKKTWVTDRVCSGNNLSNHDHVQDFNTVIGGGNRFSRTESKKNILGSSSIKKKCSENFPNIFQTTN